MKIAFASNTSWSLWNFRLDLMHALKSAGFEVYAVAPEDEYSQFLKKEFSFICIKNLNRKGRNPIKDIKLFIEYLKIYRKTKPTLVVNFTIKPNIYSSLACGLLGIRCISVITGLGYVYVKGGLLQKITDLLYKFSLRFNRNVVFQNNDDMEYFFKKRIVDKEKSVLIRGSGVNTNYFSPNICKNVSVKNSFIFLMISRLLLEKGITEYIEAGNLLKNKYPNIELWLLGTIDEGNPSAIPKSKIKEWEKEGLIKYLGETKDVRPFICQADCIVLPSYREGLPRVILEAMAMEKPVITTNTPGCKDAVIHGINGFLVKPKDKISLYQAMANMIKLLPEKRKEMGKRGREKVLKEFDGRLIINKYIELIKSVSREK